MLITPAIRFSAKVYWRFHGQQTSECPTDPAAAARWWIQLVKGPLTREEDVEIFAAVGLGDPALVVGIREHVRWHLSWPVPPEAPYAIPRSLLPRE